MTTLILNGSPSGQKGNCHVLTKKLVARMKLSPDWHQKDSIKIIHLSKIKWTATEKKNIYAQIKLANGFIFLTGTYWDSWGSPLQTFLENVTPLEGGPAFLGKPAAIFVLNHSVGGKGVLSRLQGVLSTFGCLIPPMSGLVYSWVSEQVISKNKNSQAQKDLWSLDDIDCILKNFRKALSLKVTWASWGVDEKDYRKIWL